MRYLNLYSIDFVLYNFGTFAFWTWAAFTSAGRFGAPLLAAKAGLLASEKVKHFFKKSLIDATAYLALNVFILEKYYYGTA